ncbi:aminotransferase class I/II-fold pyridoxal phosphate-dependent enzyme [Saccharicrinis fermentans]|uniref:8-amino-7-oxononanoate synthase n=1 Tax=Saccharicrinis fermentans DSM 9555 = JCM 21142 TaxID=869213 RepID=W7YPT4_9BACT|nr:8-amino-7-oxononanoate synthase [Saccharicrinis fermentans]GAF04459.1 8-amino-7-oxononanoate synthase [Saccharicrinis fermentans DSM 9555 = JCM 21142]
MDRYIRELQLLKAKSNDRVLPTEETLGLYDLCSNDYLGINTHVKLREEFLEKYNENFEFSASSSRLLSKSLKQHLNLEQQIAHSYQMESALVFNSGYHANMGVLSALPGKKDLIVADKFIHASVIDGAKLSQADFIRYKHLDYIHLEQILKRYRSCYEHVFIISESVFSMDGDVADLIRLVDIKERYDCLLYIDEAHALGVRGARGLGCAEELACASEVDFIVGTMGKAMASVGAFVACKQIFKDFLINHSRAFIFSTALPPINMAWSSFVFEKMQDMTKEREDLKCLSVQFSDLLNTTSHSHIIPFIIGSNEDAISKSLQLKQHGYHVLPIRYPTVPQGRARLRFSLCAHMLIDDLKPLQQLLRSASDD